MVAAHGAIFDKPARAAGASSNTVGGTALGAGNLISGNTAAGVILAAGSFRLNFATPQPILAQIIERIAAALNSAEATGLSGPA